MSRHEHEGEWCRLCVEHGQEIRDTPATTPILPVLDWSYGKTPTYDTSGHCLTCGTRFVVRREKGMKPPLSVECPNCECTEYSWRDYVSASAG